MEEGVHAVCHLQRDGRTHGVFLVQRRFGIDALVILRAPGDGPYLRFGCKTIRRELIEDGEGKPVAVLRRELIAESKTVIIEPEADIHTQLLRRKRHLHLVMLIPDEALLSPDGLPCRVGTIVRAGLHRPTEVAQRVSTGEEHKAHRRRQEDVLALVGNRVSRLPLTQCKRQGHPPVRG